MENSKYLTVLLQCFPEALHPISAKILSTAKRLSRDGGLRSQGAVFCTELTAELKTILENSGLDRVAVFEGQQYASFIPEAQTAALKIISGDNTEIMLFPATPEGRALSAMLAAELHTGVTADCTKLSFTSEGLLLQTRPAFSGNVEAGIVTKHTRPQMASIRFGSPCPDTDKKTEIVYTDSPAFEKKYETEWQDRLTEPSGGRKNIIIAVGGGLNDSADLKLFRTLADKTGAELCCSRELVDRGWLTRKNQIGLSGQTVSAELLIAFGISGSLQFQAGLDDIKTLCAVNTDPDAPLMKRADVPILGDVYAVTEELLKKF